MAAAPSQTLHRQELSRDEPREIHKLCLDWARWARCSRPGAVSQSEGVLREHVDPSHAGEPTAQQALTDKAVAQMYVHERGRAYKRVFDRYYLDASHPSEEEIAGKLGMRPDLVNAMLRQARMLVGTNLHRLRREA